MRLDSEAVSGPVDRILAVASFLDDAPGSRIDLLHRAANRAGGDRGLLRRFGDVENVENLARHRADGEGSLQLGALPVDRDLAGVDREIGVSEATGRGDQMGKARFGSRGGETEQANRC